MRMRGQRPDRRARDADRPSASRPLRGAGSGACARSSRELDVERVVVGLPLSLSGQDSAQTAETRAFAARLESQLTVPVELYDERFTTRLAQRTGGAPTRTRAPRRTCSRAG